MPAITWDDIGERFYETGVDHGVLYVPDQTGVYTNGVAWNGLVTITESPTGAEPNAQYADNIKYLNLFSAEEFGATLEAFTYPDEFLAFDGMVQPSPGVIIGQQPRGVFGLSYRTLVGNDLEAENHGYKLHLLYGCKASPSEKAYSTINDSPEAITFSWEISTTPVPVTGLKPTALLVIDSRTATPDGLMALEAALYGGATSPKLPTPDEVIAMFGAGAVVATGATAGTPGTWTPSGAVAPSNLAALQGGSVTASPATAWTTGEHVVLGDAAHAHWDLDSWETGDAP